MLKVNYSDLSRKLPKQIYKECDRRAIPIFKTDKFGMPSKEHRNINDLIGAIIAHDAYYEGRADALLGNESKIPDKQSTSMSKDHKKYCLRCEDADPYYLELTKEQVNLINWSIRNEILYQYAKLEEIEDIVWETP